MNSIVRKSLLRNVIVGNNTNIIDCKLDTEFCLYLGNNNIFKDIHIENISKSNDIFVGKVDNRTYIISDISRVPTHDDYHRGQKEWCGNTILYCTNNLTRDLFEAYKNIRK